MRNFLRLGHGVNIAPLMLALTRRPYLWEQAPDLLGGRNGPFGDAESIILRFPDKRLFAPGGTSLSIDPLESRDYPAYAHLPEARALVMATFAALTGERLGSVVIHRVPPGGAIRSRVDNPDQCVYYNRFHLVLHSDIGVIFCCGTEAESFEVGTLFWLDNSLEHEMQNDTRDDCIHLVFDAKCAA